MEKWNSPNYISAARLAIAPLLVFTGWGGQAGWFLVLFGVSLASDFVDGLLARLLRQKSRLGATLDTWGDVTMYLAVALGAWRLWPGPLRREVPLLAVALLLVALSGIVSLLKQRRLPSYHTWSAKCATAALGLSAFLMFAEVSPWPFRVSLVILALSALEEIGITLVLPQWTPNVRTIFHAVRTASRDHSQ